jgi:hypothetical protein
MTQPFTTDLHPDGVAEVVIKRNNSRSNRRKRI